MRLIEKLKPVDFDEEIQVSMTVKELAVIYASLASVDTATVCHWLIKDKQTKTLEEEVAKSDLSYKVYEQIQEILKKKGVHL